MLRCVGVFAIYAVVHSVVLCTYRKRNAKMTNTIIRVRLNDDVVINNMATRAYVKILVRDFFRQQDILRDPLGHVIIRITLLMGKGRGICTTTQAIPNSMHCAQITLSTQRGLLSSVTRTIMCKWHLFSVMRRKRCCSSCLLQHFLTWNQ